MDEVVLNDSWIPGYIQGLGEKKEGKKKSQDIILDLKEYSL